MSGTWLSKIFPRKSNVEATRGFATAGDGDAAVIAQLQSLGLDMAKEREVVHYLYLPTEDAAHQIAAILRQDGYYVTVRPAANASSNPPNPWLALARKIILVNPESIAALRTKLTELAGQARGEYDGWEAVVQR
jgi:hypothetical protein